jgi:hypothetical protein
MLAIITTAIGALAALAGAAIGPALTNRRDERVWLREKRARYLEEVISDLHETRVWVLRCNYVLRLHDVDGQPDEDWIADGLVELRGAAFAVSDSVFDSAAISELYCTKSVIEALRGVSESLSGVSDALYDENPAAVEPAAAQAVQNIDKAKKIIKREIGLKVT